VPVVEAVTALVLFDAILSEKRDTPADLMLLRTKIDQIDDKLTPLFLERLEIARQIGQYKKENDLPIYDPKREKDKLRDIAEKVGEDFSDYIKSLYATIFEISKDYQNRNNSID
jgi:monofunctional chorismate mutase